MRAETYRQQMGELLTLEEAFADYLSDAGPDLVAALANEDTRADALLALDELHIDAAATIITAARAMAGSPTANSAWRCCGTRVRRRSAVGYWAGSISGCNRGGGRDVRRWPIRRVGRACGRNPRTRLLSAALRGFPDPATEEMLLIAANDFDPTFRAAALGSLGWWTRSTPSGLRTVFGSRSPGCQWCGTDGR